MNALLLIAHGSKNSNSNDEIYQLTISLRKRLEYNNDRQFKFIDCAFLELVEPDIESAIGHLVQKGVAKIMVLPYFLAKGNHISRDIPKQISDARTQFPGLMIEIAPHIGAATDMLNLLQKHINESST